MLVWLVLTSDIGLLSEDDAGEFVTNQLVKGTRYLVKTGVLMASKPNLP